MDGEVGREQHHYKIDEMTDEIKQNCNVAVLAK